MKADVKIIGNARLGKNLRPSGAGRGRARPARRAAARQPDPGGVGFDARIFPTPARRLWVEGGLAHLEDLVLHDAQMDARAPTAEIIRAGRVLGARRRILSMAPGWALSTDGLAALRGGAFLPEGEGMAEKPSESDEAGGEGAWLDDGDTDSDDPLAAELAALDAALAGAARALERKPAIDPEERDPLVYDLDWDEDERMEQWRGAVGMTADLPPVLAAAMLAALWDDIEPLQHAPWLGRLLAAALLRQRGKTRSHLLCVNSGARAVPRLRLKAGRSVR